MPICETVIGRFARHRCRRVGKSRETRVSREYMRRVHRVVEFLRVPGLLRQHRGDSEWTWIGTAAWSLGCFLRSATGREDWGAQLVREVASRAYVKTMTMALRGSCSSSAPWFLPYRPRTPCQPSQQWRLSTLPRFIDATQVERLIAPCDGAPVGAPWVRERRHCLPALNALEWWQATLSGRGRGRSDGAPHGVGLGLKVCARSRRLA